jgi:prevent-host-death family protein
LRNVGITEARRRLSKLVEEAAAGETICITRRGMPVAKLVALARPRKRVDTAACEQ